MPRQTRKVHVRLPGKGNSKSHGARPVHLIITMIKWIRTSRLAIKNSLSMPRQVGIYTDSFRFILPNISGTPLSGTNFGEPKQLTDPGSVCTRMRTRPGGISTRDRGDYSTALPTGGHLHRLLPLHPPKHLWNLSIRNPNPRNPSLRNLFLMSEVTLYETCCFLVEPVSYERNLFLMSEVTLYGPTGGDLHRLLPLHPPKHLRNLRNPSPRNESLRNHSAGSDDRRAPRRLSRLQVNVPP